MIIGVLKEIKKDEGRVALVPRDVKTLCMDGAQIWVAQGAGLEAGFSDESYRDAGATLSTNSEIYQKADLLIKIKELQPEEWPFVRGNQIITGYIQAATRPELSQFLLNKKMHVLAFEEMNDELGQRPLMLPMSRLAGRLGVLLGFHHMLKPYGGVGKLPGNIQGMEALKVLIFGAGGSGEQSAFTAVALGADVTVLARSDRKFDRFEGTGIKTDIVSEEKIKTLLPQMDMIVNCVRYSPGLRLIRRSMLKDMRKGTLIVDVDAEPDGAIESSRESNFDHPVYEVDGILHMTIANLPAAVPMEASHIFSSALLPLLEDMIKQGLFQLLKKSQVFRTGLIMSGGYLFLDRCAERMNIKRSDLDSILPIITNNSTAERGED